jgi:ABC-type Fe3+ transport system permease subunit
LVAAALCLAVGLPLGNLVYKAGMTVAPRSDAAEARGETSESGAGLGGEQTLQRWWSPAKAAQLTVAAPWTHRREFGWSALIAALAALAAVAAALPLVWFGRGGGWRAGAAVAVASFGLAVPGPVLGVAIAWGFSHEQPAWLAAVYDRSIFAPWLAVWVRSLPVAIFVLWHAVRTVPRELLDAAALDGAGPWRQLTRVVFPLRRPAVLAALVAALAVGLGELSASIIVTPPGIHTVAWRVFDLLHTGYEDYVASLCLAMVLWFALLAAAARWLVGRAE